MRPAALLFLTAQNLLAAANPGAPVLQHDRFTFCHDPDYPLTGKDARWCPLVGERNNVCPTLPAACAKPPTPVDLELTLGGGSGSGSSSGSGDGDAPREVDTGDGDAEGRASRGGEVRVTIRPGSGSGNGNGSGNGDGSGNGNGSGSGPGNGNGSGSGDGNGSGRSSDTGAGDGTSPRSTPPTHGGDSPTGTPPTAKTATPPRHTAPAAPPPPPPPPPPAAQGLSMFAQVLLFLIVGAGAALIARAIAKHLSWSKKKDEEPEETEADATTAQAVAQERRGPVETDVERLLRRAQEAAHRGDFARAVEDAYAALLRRLDGAGLIDIHPSRTNGDYVRALRDRPELRASVRDIVRDVERVQFGAEPPSAGVFRAVFDRVVPIATRAVGVLALILAASVATSCGRSIKSGSRAGDAGPYGTAALDELLEDKGRTVTHRAERLSNIEDESTDKILVLLRGAELPDVTWRRIVEWTRQGGTLVVAGVRHLPDELRAEPTDDDAEVTALERCGTYERSFTFLDLNVAAPQGTKLRTAVNESSWVLRRDDAPYAVEVDIGKGRAFVFAERALFTNIAFTVADNAAFTSRFLHDLGKKHIEIADVWTGAGAGSPLEAMDRANLTPLILQLLALALLFLIWRGAHFGRPRDPIARSRRAFADHVRALGHIYHRAKASEHALGNFAAWAIERLRERYYRGTRSGLSPLAEAIATRTGRTEAEVMRVLVEAQSARESSGPPSSFRPFFRPDAKAPPRGAGEERDLDLIRALFEFLRTSKERPAGARASKPS